MHLGGLKSFLSAFHRSRRGNVTMILVLSLPLVLGAVGAAIDFSGRLSANQQLQDAVDAASVGSISTGSAAFAVASTMQSDGPIPIGVTNATNIFTKNASGIPGVTNLASSATVVKSSGLVKSVVTASATYPTTFMGLFGLSTMHLSATSASTNGMPPYLDFYLLLDVSGSMGVPSTVDGENVLATINPDDRNPQYPTGCTLACHESGSQGYTLTRTYGESSPGVAVRGPAAVSYCPNPGTTACIQLRLDAVGFAVQSLIQTASNTQKYVNQFRIGLYPFIRYAYEFYPLTYVSNTTGLNAAAANLPTLLDTGVNANLGSGGTHFENALPWVGSKITSTTGYGIGTGASVTNRQPWIFFVTDGSQDNQTYWAGSWSGSNHATTLDPSLCASLKGQGIRIAVLYIPYQPIPNPNASFANNEDGYANANIAAIPAPLKTCASSGFFFTANAPSDITSAMNTMFNQAVATDHLTQ